MANLPLTELWGMRSGVWSQNLGHENLTTKISAYMPVSRERQAE